MRNPIAFMVIDLVLLLGSVCLNYLVKIAFSQQVQSDEEPRLISIVDINSGVEPDF